MYACMYVCMLCNDEKLNCVRLCVCVSLTYAYVSVCVIVCTYAYLIYLCVYMFHYMHTYNGTSRRGVDEYIDYNLPLLTTTSQE